MKVQKCISYNLQLFKCLYLYIFYWEVVGNAARGKKKKRFKVAWRFFSRWPPVHSRLGNFTAMKVCLGIPAGEDVMLEYLCVLITQLWLFHHLHHKRVFFFFYPSAADLNLQPFKIRGRWQRGWSFQSKSPQAKSFSDIKLLGQRPLQLPLELEYHSEFSSKILPNQTMQITTS